MIMIMVIMVVILLILLAPSGALVFILVYYIHTQPLFQKISNSSDSEVIKRPFMCYIFEKHEIHSRISNMTFPYIKFKINKYKKRKYTNTQIQSMGFKDIKYEVHEGYKGHEGHRVLCFLNAAGSRVSNMTFLFVMKAMKTTFTIKFTFTFTFFLLNAIFMIILAKILLDDNHNHGVFKCHWICCSFAKGDKQLQ